MANMLPVGIAVAASSPNTPSRDSAASSVANASSISTACAPHALLRVQTHHRGGRNTRHTRVVQHVSVATTHANKHETPKVEPQTRAHCRPLTHLYATRSSSLRMFRAVPVHAHNSQQSTVNRKPPALVNVRETRKKSHKYSQRACGAAAHPTRARTPARSLGCHGSHPAAQ